MSNPLYPPPSPQPLAGFSSPTPEASEAQRQARELVKQRYGAAFYDAYRPQLDNAFLQAEQQYFQNPVDHVDTVAQLVRGMNLEQELHRRNVASGFAVDAAKLPPSYVATLRNLNVTDEQIAEIAHGVYPDLPRKEAVEKWTEVAARTMANTQASDYWDSPRGPTKGNG